MPRRNKRKSFRNFKNKSSKSSNRDAAESAADDETATRYDESESDEENATTSHKTRTTADSKRLASIEEQFVNESAKLLTTMGQQESVAHPEINTNDADASSSVVFDSTMKPTTTANKDESLPKATIKLKVVQFVGDDPKETAGKGDDSCSVADAETDINEIGDNVQDNKSIKADLSHIEIRNNNLQHKIESDVVPKLDEKKSSSQYRVESPKQIFNETTHHHMKSKRHAMLIQEITESSSSEEVKEFLNSTLVRKFDTSPTKSYRVDSPDDASDNNNNNLIEETNKLSNDVVTFSEVSESSSCESVKNEIMSMSSGLVVKATPQKAVLKIINIRELPTEEKTPTSTSTPIENLTVVKSKDNNNTNRLNKAEEAMLEALYGDKKLLEIPNLPLDVISEEGSDCGSDVERQASSKRIKDFDISSPPPQKPPRNSRRQQRQEIIEKPILISTKIVEMEPNIPESCETWESRVVGDNELEAELVYLTSASSSATDLSQCDSSTDTEDIADNSEDTETNSMLDNVCVPSFEDVPIEMKISQDYTDKKNFQLSNNEQIQTSLSDILEEDEDQSHRSSIAIMSNENNQKQHTDTEILSNFEFKEDNDNDDDDEKVCDNNEQKSHAICEEQKQIENDIEENETEKTILEEDDKKIIYDNDKSADEIVSRLTPILSKRKNSSDSSSSANSQCTIIRQSGVMSLNNNCVHPLNELCLQSLNKNAEDVKIIIEKKLNSASRNAPQIPSFSELELHYKYNNPVNISDEINLERDSSGEHIITILQVPPEITRQDTATEERWFGLQSSQVPNLMVALSPLQNSYLTSQESSNTSADVLLDMHKKFIERRAYHEVNVDTIQPPTNNHVSFAFHTNESRSSESEIRTFDDGYSADRENSVDTLSVITRKSPDGICIADSSEKVIKCDSKKFIENENVNDDDLVNSSTSSSHKKLSNMQSIRKCMRDEFFKSVLEAPLECDNNEVAVSYKNDSSIQKRIQLEDELIMLDKERENLEDELKNLQSLQHFKFEELQFAKRKLIQEDEEEKNRNEKNDETIVNKFSNDEFIDFVNSNEKLQQELYDEWQDKILERYERKMSKTIKLTPVNNDAEINDASKFSNLENEFMSKLKERRARLSLPNEITSSTESLRDQKLDRRPSQTPKPQVMHEFLKFYEEEFTQNKNSDESGELMTKSPMLISLISVSFLCGLLIGKYLTLNKTF
jgi:hypothetical protein